MTFDYERTTKLHYQSDAVAESYHRAYAEAGGLRGARFRFIADRERAAVRSLLSHVPHKSVLDIPAGTGKMAPVFSSMGCRVTACDVSENMLAYARKSYGKAELDATFHTVDLEHAGAILSQRFDVIVCVRLMQRVPNDIRRRMLKQISLLGDHAIISFGIDSAYQRLRYRVRRAFIGREQEGMETRLDIRRTHSLLSEFFVVQKVRRVAPGLSSEWIYLVTPRQTDVPDLRDR